MKIAQAKTLLFFFFLLIVSALKAQKTDYLITYHGDTLRGQFTGKKFKADNWVKAKKVDAEEYKETYNSRDNMLYRAVITPRSDRPNFLEVLENGKISLYQKTTYSASMVPGANGTSYASSNAQLSLFVAKSADSVKELEYSEFGAVLFKSKKNRMNVLAEMLKDNQDVHDKFIAEDKFGYEQCRKIIHLYNTGRLFGSDVTSDYVIIKNKDTIFCEIEPSTFSTMGRYRVNTKDRFIKMDTSVTGYFLNKDFSTYVLKSLPKNKHREYVKYLAKGKINLYAYSLNNSDPYSVPSLYASKGPGDLIQIKHAFSNSGKEDKKAFLDLISDDLNLVDKVKNLPYDSSAIVNYVKTYNNKYLDRDKSAK